MRNEMNNGFMLFLNVWGLIFLIPISAFLFLLLCWAIKKDKESDDIKGFIVVVPCLWLFGLGIARCIFNLIELL